jgi:hypothetical protein
MAFVIRLGLLVMYRPPAGAEFRPVQGWMTPRYLVHIYRLDPLDLIETLDIDPDRERGMSLAEVALAHEVPLDAIVSAVDALRIASIPADALRPPPVVRNPADPNVPTQNTEAPQ